MFNANTNFTITKPVHYSLPYPLTQIQIEDERAHVAFTAVRQDGVAPEKWVLFNGSDLLGTAIKAVATAKEARAALKQLVA